MKDSKLIYMRKSTKSKDGKKGFMYRHQWATGYDLLIFESHEDAGKYEKSLKTV